MFNPSLTLNWKRVMGFQMGKQSSLQFWIHEKISTNFVKIGQFRFGKLYLSCLYFHHYILCVFYSYFSPGKALLAGKGISRQVFFGESRFTVHTLANTLILGSNSKLSFLLIEICFATVVKSSVTNFAYFVSCKIWIWWELPICEIKIKFGKKCNLKSFKMPNYFLSQNSLTKT